jgi:hypothetical protein
MNWKEEIEKLLKCGCSDSAIEDFIDEHPVVNRKEVWDYVYEYFAPYECKGCKHIQMGGMFPCAYCSRKISTKDYYESR